MPGQRKKREGIRLGVWPRLKVKQLISEALGAGLSGSIRTPVPCNANSSTREETRASCKLMMNLK